MDYPWVSLTPPKKRWILGSEKPLNFIFFNVFNKLFETLIDYTIQFKSLPINLTNALRFVLKFAQLQCTYFKHRRKASSSIRWCGRSPWQNMCPLYNLIFNSDRRLFWNRWFVVFRNFDGISIGNFDRKAEHRYICMYVHTCMMYVCRDRKSVV